jgi:hypothetical protein
MDQLKAVIGRNIRLRHQRVMNPLGDGAQILTVLSRSQMDVD